MTCAGHDELEKYTKDPVEIIGYIGRVKVYNPPFQKDMEKGRFKVTWHFGYRIFKNKSDIGNKKAKFTIIYDFEMRGFPLTRTKVKAIHNLITGDKVKISYRPMKKRIGGCALLMEEL